MRKKIIIIFSIIFVLFMNVCSFNLLAKEQTKLLTATITMVPKAFYGTWRVTSKILDTDSPTTFQKTGLDMWNLSQVGDVITLYNIFNGAKANVTVDKAGENYVVFKTNGKYGKKVLTDEVQLHIKGDTFTGIDTLRLDTYDGNKIIKSETAKYNVKGEKLSEQFN